MVLSKETSLFQRDAIAEDIRGLRVDVNGSMSTIVPVYYRRNPQDHAADPEQPNASTRIYDVSTTDNVWTYKMPQPKKGCYFYTCEQHTSVSGTITYTPYTELTTDTYLSKWVKDANETFIDGGSLYTGSVTADKMAANSITVGKMDDDAKNQTLNSNIKIGGKNLLRGTQDLYITGAGRWIDGRFYKSGSGGDLESVTGIAPIRSISHMIKATITTANGSVGLAQAAVPLMQDTITVSAWVKGTAGDKVTMQTCWSDTSGSEELTDVAKEYTIVDGNWHRYTHTYTMQHNQISGIRAGYVYVKSATSGHIFYICGIKLEYGNKATDWSPAPEDTIHDNLLPDSQSMASYGIGSESTKTNDANKLNYVIMSNTTDQSWNASVQTRPTLDPAILDGTPLWLSFEYQFTGLDVSAIGIAVNGCAAAPGSQTVSTRTMYKSLYPVITEATGWTRFVVALPTSVSDLDIQQSGQTDTTINSVYIQIWNYQHANTVLRIRKLKLEHGDYASMWTQSSQDHQAYITYIDRDTGIRVHTAGNTTDYIQLNSNGLDVYRANTSMAQFGTTVRIGENNKQRVITTSLGLEMYDKNNVRRVRLNDAGLHIDNGSDSEAWFGSSARIGKEGKSRTEITDAGMNIFDYDVERAQVSRVRANISKTGLSLFNSSGTNVAQFADTARIGASGAPHVVINSSAMTVYSGTESATTNVAAFGATARIGPNDDKHIRIDSSGLHVWKATESTASNEMAVFGETARIGQSSDKHVRVDSDGLHVWTGAESTATNEVAFFGSTAQIGKSNSYKTLISPGGIQLLDGTGTNAFAISPSGNSISRTVTNNTPFTAIDQARYINADLSNYTVTFTLSNTSGSTVYASGTRTNSQLPQSGTWVLSGNGASCSIYRINGSMFQATLTAAPSNSAKLTASWTISNKSIAKINYTGGNTLLASDMVMYMQYGQTANLSEPISSQLNGIVLAWSAYSNGQAQNYDWNYTFIPKNHVLLFNGNTVDTGLMTSSGLSHVGCKYLKVYDDRIEGYLGNEQRGTNNGITYDNSYWVLRYVYGV